MDKYSFSRQNPPATLGAMLGLWLPVVTILYYRLVTAWINPANDAELFAAVLIAGWGAIAFVAGKLGAYTQNFTYSSEKVEGKILDAEVVLNDADVDPDDPFNIAKVSAEEAQEYGE